MWRWLYLASLCASVAGVATMGVVAALSYVRPIIWEHNPSPPAGWFFEFRLIDAGFYIGWPHFGIGYIPCLLPLLLVAAWPTIAALLWWKRRGRQPGFPIDR